jgi:hypothetical protein
MGKGSKRRPISVPLAEFKAKWDRIFKQTTRDKKMLVLYTEKQLEKAYKAFLADYEGTIVPDLEAFRILYEASEELQKEEYEIVFEPEEELVESCGGTPAGFIPKNTSIH